MEKNIAEYLAEKAGYPGLVELLSDQLPASELNSLLLEVFRRRTRHDTPAGLLRRYRENRFVQPAQLDVPGFRAFESQLLALAQEHGFTPLELSPVCPLATCSVVAPVPQHNVVSALRGTEVVADATNVLALESAHRRARAGFTGEPLRLCAAHRHVRAQSLPDPRYTAHFKVFCLTTAGRDTGSFTFEHRHLCGHWQFYHTFLAEKLGLPCRFQLRTLAGDRSEKALIERLTGEMRDRNWVVEVLPPATSYYRILQAKIVVEIGGREIEVADSGPTDWTQSLTGNRKERLVISGLGSELLFKILNG